MGNVVWRSVLLLMICWGGCQAAPGLTGSYFNNTTLTGAPAWTQVDSTIDFTWGANPPVSGLGADYYSIRWVGFLRVPSTGSYVFQTNSDDGVRLTLGGSLLIQNWGIHAPSLDTSAAVQLTAGVSYPITLDYYEWNGGSVISLRWKPPGATAFSVIPADAAGAGLSTRVLGPGGVAVPAWWGRANALSQTDGSAVRTWPNEADAQKALTGSTNAPVFRNANALNINFNPVIEFSATTTSAAQYFQGPSLLGTQAHQHEHLLIVGYPSARDRGTALLQEPGVSGSLYTHLSWSDGVIYFDPGFPSGNGVDRSTYSPTRMVNTPSLYAMSNNALFANDLPLAGNHGIRQDGVLKVVKSNTAVITGAGAGFRVGWPGTNQTWVGVLAEGMVVLDQMFTPTQLNQLESYLAVKYGITLGDNGATDTRYLHSEGGTVWTAATGYHHNVAGVGRDDASKLDQRISRSVNAGPQITATTSAVLPDLGSVVPAQTGAAFASDRSFALWGDNNAALSSTTTIAAGYLTGRVRALRAWRLQMSGSAPAQLMVCIPDALIPPQLLAGDTSDLRLTGSTAADFSAGNSLYPVTAGLCPATGQGVTALPGRYATFSNVVLSGMGGLGYFTLSRAGLDHVEVTSDTATGVTCAPTTYTIKACADAACTTRFTGGVSGTLTLTGTGVVANFPSGASFSIAAGSSTATVAGQVSTPSTATVGLSGLSVSPLNAKAVFCGLGAVASSSNGCAMTVAEAGLLFSVPHHYATGSQTLTISAVKKSDSSLACTPAFSNVTKAIKASCSYLNPAIGTQPVLLGQQALNGGNSATAACDVTGQLVNLAFNAQGQTSAVLSYRDVGLMQLNLAYAGSGADAGLVLNGSASFVAAPASFVVGALPGVTQTAGSPFSFNVTAVGWNNAAMVNFGKESPPATYSLAHVRTAPLGAGAFDGALQATPGAFNRGVSTVSGATWSEVGQIALSASLVGDNYLGSGLTAAGSAGTSGWTFCAAEKGTCTIPAGLTAAVHFGLGSMGVIKVAQTGDVPCTVAHFGNPNPGGAKSCSYTPLSGVGSATAHVSFKPHHFDVSASNACGSFSYAGQPFGATVTAKSQLGNTTLNYDGTSATSPNFARTVAFSEGTANPLGLLSGGLSASAFRMGAASVAGSGVNAPRYGFTNKLTPEQRISLRAIDSDGVSSLGYSEGSMTLRSGRLVMSNAFGSDKTSLQVPLQLQYWSGKSWVVNGDDVCTSVPKSAVVRAQAWNHNNTPATWTSTVQGVNLVAGSGSITLGAPIPSGTGTLDLAINLGSTNMDSSCLAEHPQASSTGAALPWLRSRAGACATGYGSDPSARATFGVFTPEARKTVHVREVF